MRKAFVCTCVCETMVGPTVVEQEKGMTVVVLCCAVLCAFSLSGCFELCVAACVILFLWVVVVDL